MADRPRLTVPSRPSANGHSETEASVTTMPEHQPRQADGRGKRIANRTPWLDLPEPFDNLKVRVWLDYPKEVADQWGGKREGESDEDVNARITEACKAVFLEHDGWEDEQGLLPSPDTDEFWERIPNQLAKVTLERFFAELAGNPTSAAPSSRRRTRRI